MSPSTSIIIRTFNEAKWLASVLEAIARQDVGGGAVETIVVDSGSGDGSVDIARRFGCSVVPIQKDVFTFGRSLNKGCEAASGRHLVFISGHCVPVDSAWLRTLLAPLEANAAEYVYGRQLGHESTRFSEKQIFAKYYPVAKANAQGGIYCNNANAAICADVWQRYRFDENLTGLEDMELAKRLLAGGLRVDYVPEAPVYHIHEESWSKVRLRYEREALALQMIMPEVHVHFGDFLRYFTSAALHDSGEALQQRALMRQLPGILAFRLMQYWGVYRGNNDHRRLSRLKKERYFYPR